jgi:hypothetical protein
MATHRVVLTYEDYLAMPDDGRRYEILDGEVAVTATPVTGRVHGDARTALPPFPDRILGVDELWQP